MELIEIVKSSIFFFSLGLIVLLIFAFGYFKLRNRARKESVPPVKQSNLRAKDSFSESKKSSSLMSVPDSKKRPKPTESLSHHKYVVINDDVKDQPIQNSKSNYSIGVYKYYEESDSQMMFKLKIENVNRT